jgi:hypothetical protein
MDPAPTAAAPQCGLTFEDLKDMKLSGPDGLCTVLDERHQPCGRLLAEHPRGKKCLIDSCHHNHTFHGSSHNPFPLSLSLCIFFLNKVASITLSSLILSLLHPLYPSCDSDEHEHAGENIHWGQCSRCSDNLHELTKTISDREGSSGSIPDSEARNVC